MSFLNATSMTGWIPQHWRRSLTAHVLLLAVVAAANLNLAHTRGRGDAVPSRQSKVADANRVTTRALEPAKVGVAPVRDVRQAGSSPIGEHD